MRVSLSSTPSQSRQIRQRLASPEDSLSYELGKAVQELPPLYTRILAGTVSVLVFGSLAWAYFSKIDEVAVAQGELVPLVQVRPVRALAPGSVQSIQVQQGDTVKKGDVLLEMNADLPEIEVGRLEKSVQLIQEDLARLEAERAGQSRAGTLLQDQLLSARLKEFDSKQAAAVAEANRQISTIDESKVRLERLAENLMNARENLKNAQEQEQGLRTLLTDNAVPRLEYIRAKDNVTNAEDKVVTLEKEIDAQREKIRQAEEAYQSARNTAEGLGSERRTEVLTQLTKRREELTSLQGQLAQAKKQRDREIITAPYNGTIYSIKATRGPTQAGEELLSILPKGENLVLEVKVLNRDIGFVREGLPAKVKLAAFPYQEFGTIDGKVLHVSPNATVDKDLGLVFPTQVQLNQTTVQVRGQTVDLTPGMAATADVVLRKKSILTFLIEPVTRRFNDAFSVR